MSVASTRLAIQPNDVHGKSGFFQYDILRSDIPQIRVLHILLGEPDSPIEISLKVTNITAIQDCEALSYMWGPPARDHQILCNGNYLMVTANLIEILKILRERRRSQATWTRGLWIDAICINQDDLDERSAQIKFMSTIYRTAARVLAYIGPEPPFAEEVFKVFGFYSGEVKPDVSGASDDLFRPAVHNMFKTLFMSHEYFSRLWIVQELVLPEASRIEILFGAYSRPWTSFVKAFVVFKEVLDRQPLAVTSLPYLALDGICTLRWGAKKEHVRKHCLFQIAMICTFTQQMNVSVPHDRVFGLLGILPKENQMALSLLNYKTSVTICLAVATIVLALESNNVNYLGQRHTACDKLTITWSAFHPELAESVQWSTFGDSFLVPTPNMWFSVGTTIIRNIEKPIDPFYFADLQPRLHIDAIVVDIVTCALSNFSEKNLCQLVLEAFRLVNLSPKSSNNMPAHRILCDVLFGCYGSEETKRQNALLFRLVVARWYLLSLGFSEANLMSARRTSQDMEAFISTIQLLSKFSDSMRIKILRYFQIVSTQTNDRQSANVEESARTRLYYPPCFGELPECEDRTLSYGSNVFWTAKWNVGVGAMSDNKLGALPTVRALDVVAVLGSTHFPVILRRVPCEVDVYKFVCAARIPELVHDDVIQNMDRYKHKIRSIQII